MSRGKALTHTLCDAKPCLISSLQCPASWQRVLWVGKQLSNLLSPLSASCFLSSPILLYPLLVVVAWILFPPLGSEPKSPFLPSPPLPIPGV